MGQIFNRISSIFKSEVSDSSSKYADTIINSDDEELRRIIEELKSEKNKGKKSDNSDKNSNENIDIKLKSAYLTLGINPNLSIENIKIAYKNKIKENHPDKFVNVSNEIHLLAIEKTKKINEAYSLIKIARKFA